MKQFILICFLAFCFWGHAHDPLSGSFEEDPWVGPIKEASFLTSFIKEGQLYLDIPEAQLEKPMLLTCYYGMRRGAMQVVWSKHNDKMILKQQAVASTSGIVIPIKEGLDLMENILAIFPKEKESPNSQSHRVKVTDFFLNQEMEWSQNWGVAIGSSVPQLSLLKDAKDFRDEVIIKVHRGMIRNKTKVAAPVYFGLSALGPPMKARRFDFRMGFYPEGGLEVKFGLQNGLANITRWRLEKKFKHKKISVPIKPITFLISPDVPKKWRPYLKAGIEKWLPAFESAGFKDALVVKEVDSLNEWQEHSIHTNVVYWNQQKYMRGSEYKDFGGTIGHVIDLRTGEILRGDIFMAASERTVMEKYFIRAAPLDKRAQRFPFPDDLIGELFQVIAAHEAGHVFGITDANFGESHYPWDKMNDSLWLRTMGHTPSVMNYTRSSNIPQPEDSIAPSLLLRHVGPTDRYNIQWGYMEFPEGTSSDAEKKALDRMVRWQDSVPWYRFNKSQMEVIGPAASNEVVETNDPVRSTQLALKNLERVLHLIPEATQGQNDHGRLNRLYEKSVELWYNHMVHVSTLIGGYDIQYKSFDQPGNMYTPIPWEDQTEALGFLMSNAFDPPDWLIEPDFQSKVKYSTFPDLVLQYQQRLVIDLLKADRMKRMEYSEEGFEDKGLVNTYLTNLQRGLFREVWEKFDEVERRRQAVQMSYIDTIIFALGQEVDIMDIESQYFVHSDESKGLLMQQLLDLKKELEKGMNRNANATTLGHWQLCLSKINSIL